MLLIRRPSDKAIREFLRVQAEKPFSYPEIGASRLEVPATYNVDHNRVRLGEGEEIFSRALEAFRGWKMFHLGWLEFFFPDTPIRAGETVAILIRCFFVWFLSPCRIVYAINDEEPVRRFGFAYGALDAHEERGEERFTIEWYREDNSVWYDILSFSKPGHWWVWLGYPLNRRIQRRFAEDSKAAMIGAVSSSRA